MTHYQKRALETLTSNYGASKFTRFDAACALETAEGNVTGTLRALLRAGFIKEVSPLTYKVI